MKDLIDKMLRPKCHTNLRKIDDTSVLTGVVKSFLMKLKQPLLTESLSEEFKLAAGQHGKIECCLVYSQNLAMLLKNFHFIVLYDSTLCQLSIVTV